MKKLFIVMFLFLFLLVPTTAQALTIGDIDFNRVIFNMPFHIEGHDAFSVRIHPYPEDNIKIIVVVCEIKDGGRGAWILELRYLKDNELFVYRPSGTGPGYNRAFTFKPGEVKAITKHLVDSLKYLK